MMKVIPKWQVTVRFADREIVLWVYDTSAANVLRKIADLQFTETGLESPVELRIRLTEPT